MDIRVIEKIFKALANKRRLAIVQYLKKHKEASVAAIAEVTDLSFKSTSRHLGVLLSADILEKEQRNVYVFYRLSYKMNDMTQKIISLF